MQKSTKKHYEFVLAINSKMEQDAQKKLLENIESNFKDWILDKDVIWNIKTEYLFGGKKENETVFMISYYLLLETSQIKSTKDNLKYMEWIIRSFFFSMNKNDKFFHFKDLNKNLKKTVDEFKNKIEK